MDSIESVVNHRPDKKGWFKKVGSTDKVMDNRGWVQNV